MLVVVWHPTLSIGNSQQTVSDRKRTNHLHHADEAGGKGWFASSSVSPHSAYIWLWWHDHHTDSGMNRFMCIHFIFFLIEEEDISQHGCSHNESVVSILKVFFMCFFFFSKTLQLLSENEMSPDLTSHYRNQIRFAVGEILGWCHTYHLNTTLIINRHSLLNTSLI